MNTTRKKVEKQFNENFRELRKILNSRELIPGSPEDEFDSINHQILTHLYNGVDLVKLVRVLDGQLTVNYGLTTDIEEVKEIASEIMEWWNQRN